MTNLAEAAPSITNVWEFIAWLLPFLLLSAGQVYLWWDNRVRMEAAAAKADAAKTEATKATSAISIRIDGRLTQLLEQVARASKAEGIVEGTASERTASTAAVVAVAAATAPTPVPAEIAVIQRQNQVSIDDRASLHAELDAMPRPEGEGHP